MVPAAGLIHAIGPEDPRDQVTVPSSMLAEVDSEEAPVAPLDAEGPPSYHPHPCSWRSRFSLAARNEACPPWPVVIVSSTPRSRGVGRVGPGIGINPLPVEARVRA